MIQGKQQSGHDLFEATPTFRMDDGVGTVPGPSLVDPGPTNPSALVLRSKEDSTEENTATVPAMTSDRGAKQALIQILKNGYAVDTLDREVDDEPGPIRYLRADDIGECRAYGVSGSWGGHPVTALAHLSSHAYGKNASRVLKDENGVPLRDRFTGKPLPPERDPTFAAYTDLCEALKRGTLAPQDAPGRHPIRRIGATAQYVGAGSAQLLTHDDLLARCPVHVAPDPGHQYASYLLDTQDFDLHLAGKTEDGVTPIGPSVRSQPTLSERDKAYGTKDDPDFAKAVKRTKKSRRRPCTIL